MTKKIFFITIFVLAFAFIYPEVTHSATCPELIPGEVVKAHSGSAVYFVTEDLETKYYANDEVFFTWHESWDIVRAIDGACLDLYPLASPAGMTYRPGSRLIKRLESPSIYVVSADGVRSKVESPSILNELYGSSWGVLVRDVPSYNWPNYKKGSALTEVSPHEGQLIKTPDRSTVYYVGSEGISKLSGSLNLWSQDVRTVSDTTFSLVSEVGEIITKADIVSELLFSVVDTSQVPDKVDVIEHIPEEVPDSPEAVVDPVVDPVSTYTISTLEQQTIDELNAYRKANGLGVVVHDNLLYEIAKGHSQYMFDTDDFAHTGFDDRFDQAYNEGSRTYCVENLAWNYPNAYDTIWIGWQNSPAHNEGMLKPNITDVGMSWVGAYVTMFACE
ncbi:CAP domain-containing protein [Candidatus Parcubacteria bacterium]|jgi:uncharacterized protein YkwD|nr:CAP domain-containing protein [Candidatus Parcubacteria bacterium]MBT3949115.1 CAP domain-containing protein [Candidatus Parcubacteria bacterium]